MNEAADSAIKRFRFIDASKQIAGGASYGGHLTNWLAVTTTRYRALVSHAGEWDLETQWATSDFNYDRERNVGRGSRPRLLVELGAIGFRQIHQKGRDLLGHGFDVAFPPLGSRRRGIP